jgi:hypothetical protein
MRVFAGRVWRDDGLAAALRQPVAQPAGIVGAVGEQAARGRDAGQKLRHTGQVMRLAGRQAERDGASDIVGQGVNLGRPSAARSPDGLRELPPFPPEAERCALTEVLSALVVPITPEEPDKT